MSVHEQFAEDLALYALGALHGDEREVLEKHLDECAACRRELQQLQGDMALLALSVSGPKPPQRSKQRLMSAIAKEPRRTAQRRRAWWPALQWVSAAALLFIAVMVLRQNGDLQRRVAELEGKSFQQEEDLLQAKQVVATLTAPEADRYTLVAGKTPQPQGKAIYWRARGSLIFLANNLPPLAPQKAYELWLIPINGVPIPAGVFKPDAHGSATVVNPPLSVGVEAKTFAITVEPEGGSSAPTTQPIMVGIGE